MSMNGGTSLRVDMLRPKCSQWCRSLVHVITQSELFDDVGMILIFI